jgi:adenylate kinase family enzyme
MHLPDKIYILGGAGSWKSSLAKKISIIKQIPHFYLDDILRFKKYTEKLPTEQRMYKLHQILKEHNKRVIEWCSVDRPDECYKQADLVIVLDVSTYIVAWRIFKRYVSRIIHWDFRETFRWMMWLAKRAMSYQDPKRTHSLRRHIEDCKKYKCNYVVVRDAKEVLN